MTFKEKAAWVWKNATAIIATGGFIAMGAVMLVATVQDLFRHNWKQFWFGVMFMALLYALTRFLWWFVGFNERLWDRVFAWIDNKLKTK